MNWAEMISLKLSVHYRDHFTRHLLARSHDCLPWPTLMLKTKSRIKGANKARRFRFLNIAIILFYPIKESHRPRYFLNIKNSALWYSTF